jgi:hypothetical protein
MNEAVVLFCGIFMGLGIAEITRSSSLRELEKELKEEYSKHDNLFEERGRLCWKFYWAQVAAKKETQKVLRHYQLRRRKYKELHGKYLSLLYKRQALKEITKLSQEAGLYE